MLLKGKSIQEEQTTTNREQGTGRQYFNDVCLLKWLEFAKKKKKKECSNLYSSMNIKVVEYTYPLIVLSVIYLICDCRDLRHTNNVQDVAFDELTKSLPLMMRTNIDSYHNNNKNSNKIEAESENLNHESDHKKDDYLHQATVKEDLAHHNETKIEKSMSMNGGDSRKASHSTNDKHRNGRDVSMIPTYDYRNRKSFDAAHRIKNNKKESMKEIWPKQNLFPNNSRKVLDQKRTGGDGLKKLKQKQKQGLQERKKQLDRNMKLNNDNVSITNRRLENTLKSEKGRQKKSSEGIEKTYVVEKRRLESYMNETTLSRTSCVLTKAEIIPLCDDDKYDGCSKWVLDGYCTNSTFMSNADGTFKDWMIENCRRSCNACPTLPSLESQIQYIEYDKNATTFNLSLDVTTDYYAHETSWTFLAQNSEDSIFDSSEVNITSELENYAEHKFNYYCTVSKNEGSQLNNKTKSTCYNFEVHDTYGDGMCCEYGFGFFSLSVSSMNIKTLDFSNEFEYGFVMSTSFCLDHNDGDSESNEVSEEPTDYPSLESEGIFIIDDEEISDELTDYPSPTPTNQPSHNLESNSTETNPYHTSCTATKAEIISCDDENYHDYSSSCGFRASIGDCSKPDEKDWMDKNCRKSCNTCPTLPSLESQIIQQEDIENIISKFNVSLIVDTDNYARDTSWILFPKDSKDSTIFNSSELNATSQLLNNERHVIQYNCIISQEKEFQITNDAASTCYNFEVYDSFGDGMCCEYGYGSFTLNLNTNSSTLQISDRFEDGILMNVLFCINNNNGEIESVGKFSKTTKEQPTYSHYPFRRWQCKNDVCVCDSKPSLTSNIYENHVFLLELAMLSDSDKLQDVESAQYKAACWVLYDDPYENYDLTDESNHNRKIQRYILAVLYFATSPKKWRNHRDFLSSHSECDWYYGIFSCDEDDNVIHIVLSGNNLDGTIVDELSGLRMLEVLDLGGNRILGTIPAVLGRLSQLRVLDLDGNDLEGTIPPQLGRLSNLHDLDLRENDLEGTIPPQLFNVTNLEELDLSDNRLEGTISETIGNLQNLSELRFRGNNLSGSIPDTIYSLKNLKDLWLEKNKLSSSISPLLIGNLNKLQSLSLDDNMLTGQIPSTIGSLSSLYGLVLGNNRLSGSIPSTIGNLTSLQVLYLNNNRLSGSIPSTMENMTSLYTLLLNNNRLSGSIPSTMENMKKLYTLFLNNNTLSGSIPESLFDAPLIEELRIQDNSVTGSIPDEFCERFDDYDYFYIVADCRNDVFDLKVSCSCCVCKDESPIRDGDCADATIKFVIDHGSSGYGSFNLKWSLTNDATGKKILNDGPYKVGVRGFQSFKGFQTYEECVAYSDCFSFNQISPPHYDINYYIYWNNNSIYNGTFLGYRDNDDINKDDPTQTLLSFSYNEENQNATSCYDIKLECYEKAQHITLKPNSTERTMYDQVIKISGKAKIQDTSSLQSKALCWMVNNYHYDNKTEISETEIIQRYVLAILHAMSPDGLFGGNEHQLDKHECDWHGITCTNNITKIVTGISLSSENNQIINGTLIGEIGSLKYLKVLELNQTQLHGTIPRSFSNLWSLMKLDLSGNEISSTIPATLFQQLYNLVYIDLSDNKLSGSINDDIGSYSRIRSLSLGKNLLTGSLPLDGFKHDDLEHLDIGENELSQIDLSLLPKHKNLKLLDVSRNFLVGSLLEHTFTSLSKLEYFNISQNDFSGTIPSSFPELSNITHLDIHSNRFRGTIPLGITELRSIQHLNLQGNQLTGSLPSQLNKLISLDTLILSHNELKGLIPFDPTTLQNIQKLHLHSNKLSGKAAEFNNITSYISDCGFPSDSLEPVSCPSCNTCCNSDGVCLSKTSEKLSQVQLTVIFVVTIAVLISMCYIMKDYITSNKYLKSFFSEKVFFWNAMVLISDRSVYHFLLAKNKTEWFVAVCCVVFQTATLFLFVHSADIANEISDREYTMVCPANSLECENSRTVSSYGLFVFGLILTIWLMKDIVGSIKLMLVSFQKRSIDFFFASAVIFTVTMLSIWTSVIYIIAIAIKNTDMIKDAVVLLFVVEIDERIFQLVESINPDWIKAIDNNMRSSFVYGGDDLVITSWAQKSAKSMESIRQKIRERAESFRMRNSKKGSGKREVKDKEEVEELHGESDVAVGDCSL